MEEVRLAIYSVRSQFPPNTRSIKAMFSLEGSSRVEPSSRKQLSLRCSQSSWAGKGEPGEGRGLLGGPFPSEMTDAFPQLQASASAHWGQRKPCLFPGGDEREVSPGSPPPGPLSSGAEEVQRQGMGHGDRDTETHGERQRYVDTEVGETKSQAGKLRKTTDRD